MSHPINDILKEKAFEEGLELGVKRGLTGEELTAFAYNYAQQQMEREANFDENYLEIIGKS